MNREEIRDDVRSIMDELYPTATWTNPMLNTHINRAYSFVSNAVRSSNKKYYFTIGSIVTVAGTRSYSLPSDCIASNVSNVIDSEGKNLIPDDVNDFDINDTSSNAIYYDIANNLIFLDPVPTDIKTYTLYYYRKPTVLSSDSSELDFPAGFETAVALKAAMFAVKSIHGMWEEIESDYREYYSTMLVELKSNKGIQPKRIEISRGNFGKRYINDRLV